MDTSPSTPDDARRTETGRRSSVPITVLATDRRGIDVLQRLAADHGNFVIASDEALAAAGLLGSIWAGRAAVTAADVTSRTPGCECCQVRVDLVEAVRHAALRRSPPKRLIVVVDQPQTIGWGTDDDPATDVVTCIHTLQADDEIERLAHLDALVVGVDACAISTRLACGMDLWNEQTEAALAIADRIVANGAELLTTAARSAVKRRLETVNRIGQIVLERSCLARVEDIVDLGGWDRAPVIGHRATPRGDRASAVETVVLTRSGVLDPDATDAWLDQVVAESSSRLLRFQAVLRVSDHGPRVCVRGSRSVMRSRHESTLDRTPLPTPHGAPARNGDNVVVLIGRELDRSSLDEGFGSIEVAR